MTKKTNEDGYWIRDTESEITETAGALGLCTIALALFMIFTPTLTYGMAFFKLSAVMIFAIPYVTFSYWISGINEKKEAHLRDMRY